MTDGSIVNLDKMIEYARSRNASHDQEQEDREFATIRVPRDMIPVGARLVEAYETETEIIVLGWPKDGDDSHNCDAMGCSSVSHVMHRIEKERAGK